MTTTESGATVHTTHFSYAGTYRAVSAVQRTVLGLPSITEHRQWNQKGQLTAVDYAGYTTAASLEYRYNRIGGLWRVCDTYLCDAEVYSTVDPTSAYNALGQLVEERFGNGVRTTNAYYPHSHRLWNRTTQRDATVLAQRQYTYDVMANLTALTDPMQLLHGGAKTNITYDALNRLTGYHADGVTPVAFAYDVTGNLLSNGDAAGAAYTYGGAQPHAVTQVGTRGLDYDANGNLIDDGQCVLTWNAANQLALVTLSNGTVVHHTYDHTGARVQQRVEAVNTYGKPEGWVTYWFSEALEVRVPLLWPAATSGPDPPPGSPPGMAEPPAPTLDLAHATATLHVLVDGQRLASRGITGLVNDPPTDPTAKSAAEFLVYHHTDHLGSSDLMTEGRAAGHYAGLTYPKGSVVQRFEHAPFGQESFALNPNLPFDPRFTGQTYDVDTGLSYFRARYYDPVLARFISPDPIVPDPTHPQSYNRYAYVRNNPLRFTDPTGHYESPDAFSNPDSDPDRAVDFFEADLNANSSSTTPSSPDPSPASALEQVTTAGETASRTEKIGVGFEAPAGLNRFGHSFIQVDEDVYDLMPTGATRARERHRSLDEVLADKRNQDIVALSVTPEQKSQLQSNLESTVGNEHNYDLFTCNCADYVEDRLEEVGINLPEGGRVNTGATVFGQQIDIINYNSSSIDAPEGTLDQAREHERKAWP